MMAEIDFWTSICGRPRLCNAAEPLLRLLTYQRELPHCCCRDLLVKAEFKTNSKQMRTTLHPKHTLLHTSTTLSLVIKFNFISVVARRSRFKANQQATLVQINIPSAVNLISSRVMMLAIISVIAFINMSVSATDVNAGGNAIFRREPCGAPALDCGNGCGPDYIPCGDPALNLCWDESVGQKCCGGTCKSLNLYLRVCSNYLVLRATDANNPSRMWT